MSDDIADPKIMYGTKNKKQKRSKQSRQKDSTTVLANLNEMFPDIDQKVIENIYFQMKKDVDQVINKLISLPRNENKVDSYFEEIGHYVDANNNKNSNSNSNTFNNTDNISFNNSITEQLNEIQFQSNLAEMSETVRFVFGENQDYQEIMEECQTSIINFLEREDFNYSDFLGVDSNQIPEQYAQEIQQFIEQIIFKKNFEVADNMDDFPPIPEIEGENPYINEKSQNIVISEKNSGFYCGQSINDQINDENFIRQLCEQFPQITYSKIKYAYEQFENYDQCRQFFKQYYNHEYQPKRERKKIENKYSQQKDFGQQKVFDKRLLNPNEIRLELQRNRKNIQNLYCQKETFDRCVGKHGNIINAANFQNYRQSQQAKLQDLYYEAKCILIELMEAEGTYDKVDLHGFYGVEIEGLLDDIFDLIQKVKTTKKHQLEIVVGKGIHSKNRQPVIRPITERYLKQKGIPIISNSDGKIIVKL